MRKLSIFIGLFIVALFTQAQTVRYVRPTSYGLGDASSWGNASADLQFVINQSNTGDSIWVAAGTYYPLHDISDDSMVYYSSNLDTLLTNTPKGVTTDCHKAFSLKADVKIYGGFPNNGTAVWTDRNWNAYPTILSGDIGIPNDSSDNCYHVVISAGDVGSACLDGFTITKGYANDKDYIIVNGYGIGQACFGSNMKVPMGSGNFRSGGGMYIAYSSPLLINLNISENTAINFGGGMHNVYSSPTLINISISENVGGGMYNELYSSPILTNVIISGNSTSFGFGGGMHNEHYSSPILTEVIINKNKSIAGGGMANRQYSSPILTNVIISENLVSSGNGGGGGMYNAQSSPVLTNVIISGNLVDVGNGGGIYNNGSTPILTNVIIIGNKANGYSNEFTYGFGLGGGIFNWYSPPSILTNVTISGNYAHNYGGGIYNVGNLGIIRNSIICGNEARIDRNVYNNSGSNPTYYYSLVERNSGIGGVWDATLGIDMGNNLPCDANPLFVDPVFAYLAPTIAGNYRLGACSPAIDVGNNTYNNILTDVDGNPRIYKGAIDLGGYEFQQILMIHNPDTTICYGDSSTFFFLFTGTPPWQLIYTKNNGINYDTIKNITNNLFQWRIKPLQTTIYKFVAVNDSCCMPPLNDSIQIKVLPNPTVTNVFKNDTLCSGEKTQTVVFSGNATSFEWISSGDSIDSIPTGIQIGNFDEYIVENKGNVPLTNNITITPKYTDIESRKTCLGKDTTFSITVFPDPTLTNIFSNDTLCSGEKTNSIVFTGNANLYEWISSGDIISHIPTGTQTGNFGEYIVENNSSNTPLTSRITVIPKYTENGKTCLGANTSFSITVSRLPDTTVRQNDNMLIASSLMGDKYQWYFNGTPIPDATKQVYTYTQNGVYYVIVTNRYGCSSKSAEIIIGDVSIVKTVSNTELKIYPNPTTGKLKIESRELKIESLEIYDIYGRKLSHFTFHDSEIEIDISHLSAGIYFLRIDGKTMKLIKE